MLMLLSLLCAAEPAPTLFARENLVAWCIVPFDARNRGPEERVAMLKSLGFKKYAYDWRAQHLPTFAREVELLKQQGIELTGVWFPASLNDDAKKLLAVIEKHQLQPTLWVMLAQPKGPSQQERVTQAAAQLCLVAEAAAKLGCKVGIYNHGGWSGEPENQMAVIQSVGMKNVGIVYNLHHGHEHLDRFPELLVKMKPHLLCLNVNGMSPGGDRAGKKILVLGHGEKDRDWLKTVQSSGYKGPIGILGHTQDDVELRLRDNLDGLDWLLKDGGPQPKTRTKPGQ